jgi:hypothetical protein
VPNPIPAADPATAATSTAWARHLADVAAVSAASAFFALLEASPLPSPAPGWPSMPPRPADADGRVDPRDLARRVEPVSPAFDRVVTSDRPERKQPAAGLDDRPEPTEPAAADATSHEPPLPERPLQALRSAGGAAAAGAAAVQPEAGTPIPIAVEVAGAADAAEPHALAAPKASLRGGAKPASPADPAAALASAAQSKVQPPPRDPAVLTAVDGATTSRLSELRTELTRAHDVPVHVRPIEVGAATAVKPAVTIHGPVGVPNEPAAAGRTVAAAGALGAGSVLSAPSPAVLEMLAAAASPSAVRPEGDLAGVVPPTGIVSAGTSLAQSPGLAVGGIEDFDGLADQFGLGLAGRRPADGGITAPARTAATNAGPPVSIPDQIALQIGRAARSGIDRIEIQLHPASLGRIEVKLDLGRDGHLQALILADSRDVLELLKADVRSLEQTLRDAGLQASADNLHFDVRGNPGQTADSRHAPAFRPQDFAEDAHEDAPSSTPGGSPPTGARPPSPGNGRTLDLLA